MSVLEDRRLGIMQFNGHSVCMSLSAHAGCIITMQELCLKGQMCFCAGAVKWLVVAGDVRLGLLAIL